MAHVPEEALFSFEEEEHLMQKSYAPGFFAPNALSTQGNEPSELDQEDAVLEEAPSASQAITNSPQSTPPVGSGGTPKNINSPKKPNPNYADEAHTFLREPRPVVRPKCGV